MRTLRAVDLFCGAGGTSYGAEASGAARVEFAANHWPVAIETHARNFPHCRHACKSIDQVSPGEVARIDLLFASPECTHHSRARGGRPMNDQKRSTAWDVLKWVDFHRPSYLVIENVVEFEEWGPLDRLGRPLTSLKGKTFQAWTNAIRSMGYRVEWRRLNAADFGEATSRVRLIVIARKGNRPVSWPEPTHCQNPGRQLPGMQLQRWRSAAEIIDWSKPCPSIFNRKRPLADKTLLRIEAGLRRFCSPANVEAFIVRLRNNCTAGPTGEPLPTITAGGGHHGVAVPMVVQWDNHGGNGSYVRSCDGPLGTIVTKQNMGLAVPYLVPRHGEREGQEPRTHDAAEPVPGITCSNTPSLAMPFFLPRQGIYDSHTLKRARSVEETVPTIIASHGPGHIVVPYLVDVNHGDDRHASGRSHDLDGPLGTVTAHNGKALVAPFVMSHCSEGAPRDVRQPIPTMTTTAKPQLIVPFLTGYYGTGGSQLNSVDEPLPTVTTKDRFGLAMVRLIETMRELNVVDIGFRMLDVDELAAAMGFPPTYYFAGNKSQKTKQIGNAVSTRKAQAITEAIAA